ncbi:hypothetical protein DFQ28_000252, partial [Apophysomyces sp. BC1034]
MAFNSSQLMERTMPEMVLSLEAGFGLVHTSMQAMQSSQASEFNKLHKLWSDFFALGNAHF